METSFFFIILEVFVNKPISGSDIFDSADS